MTAIGGAAGGFFLTAGPGGGFFFALRGGFGGVLFLIAGEDFVTLAGGAGGVDFVGLFIFFSDKRRIRSDRFVVAIESFFFKLIGGLGGTAFFLD